MKTDRKYFVSLFNFLGKMTAPHEIIVIRLYFDAKFGYSLEFHSQEAFSTSTHKMFC